MKGLFVNEALVAPNEPYIESKMVVGRERGHNFIIR